MALMFDSLSYHYIKPSSVRLAVLALMLLEVAHGRRWEDVISVSIYAQSHVDIPRIQFAIEENPLNLVPTMMLLLESQPPSDAPSQVPSYYHEEESSRQTTKLVCPTGEAAYKLKKYDTWGDGWGQTTITIRQTNRIDGAAEATVSISKDVTLENATAQAGGSSPHSHWSPNELEDYVLIGGMRSGDFDSQQVCLSETGCYEVKLQGGKWQEETKWEITSADVEGTAATSQAVAKGRGFTNCTFYVTEDPVGPPNCSFTCRPRPETDTEETDAEAEEEIDELQAQGKPEAESEEAEEEAKMVNTTGQSDGFGTLDTRVEPLSASSDAPSLVPSS